MRHAPQSGDLPSLIRQFDEWIVTHRLRLLACARLNADEMTDIDLLLADTLRKVARVYCKRRMSEELMVRYTMRSLRNAAREAHRRNRCRHQAESRYSEAEMQRHEQSHAPTAQNELHAALREAMQSLPEPYADVLLMKVWQRMTFVDIAQHIGVAESTARRYYETAIDLVRKRMGTL